MQGQNLQLAISANAAIKGVLLDKENAIKERLEEASRHLSELVDNLESEFLKCVAAAGFVKPNDEHGSDISFPQSLEELPSCGSSFNARLTT